MVIGAFTHNVPRTFVFTILMKAASKSIDFKLAYMEFRFSVCEIRNPPSLFLTVL